uniref:Histone acetyltransferase n=1 Tax=Elaeis guineensis var. tenera TaxID=51953 RepID=A0A6I9R2V2_ELAGV|nr:putative MYST-like histone acetyltransferase 1 isoform X2 [Elaeis guineensis]
MARTPRSAAIRTRTGVQPLRFSSTVQMGSIEGAKAENGVAAPACNGGDQRNGGGGAAVRDSEAEAGRKGKAGAGVALPLEVGTRVMCRWRDQKLHPVKVIERRKIPNAGPNDYEYYVHYTEFNRRLDEWVKLEQLDLDTVETDIDEKVEDKATSLKMTRHQKRKIDETHVEKGHEELDAASLREHEEFTKVKNIAKIELGRYEIDTWYFSPFPPEYNDSSKLYFCEFCLNFMKRKEQLQRHMRKCDLKHPPGDEIYRSGTLSMFEEKHSEESYNLACILTLPPYQRKGYGKFLIAFSYELSKKEGKVGTPERPLSDLGLLSYRGYWTRVLLDILKKHKSNISIKELSDMTAIKADDILSTLQSLDLIQYRKGQHVICADPKVLDRHLKAAGRGGLEVDVSKLIWTPYKEQG